MASKLVKSNADGSLTEYAGKVQSTGATDAGEFPVLDGTGKLDPSTMPNGLGADVVVLVAAEALAANDFVYIDATGKAAKADATSIAKAARGYVLAAVALGGNASVYFDDQNAGAGLTGLTPGKTQYLSATAGKVTETAPTTSGQIVQELGVATAAGAMHVGIKQPIVRA